MTQGMKSTELWLTVAVLVFIALGQWQGWSIEPEMAWAMVFGSGSYAVGRGLAKTGEGGT